MGNEKRKREIEDVLAEEVMEAIECFTSIISKENIPQEAKTEALNRLGKRAFSEAMMEECNFLNKIYLDGLRNQLAELLADEKIPEVFRDDVTFRVKDNDFHADYLQQQINFLKRVKQKEESN